MSVIRLQQSLRKPSPFRTEVLAGQNLLRDVRRIPSPCHPAADVYAKRWGMLVELEAAASAVEGNDSRLLFDVPINWADAKSRHSAMRGSFNIPASLAKSHKLKFRGVMTNGGESASSWLCLRCHDLSWSAHARIIQAGILEARRLQSNTTSEFSRGHVAF